MPKQKVFNQSESERAAFTPQGEPVDDTGNPTQEGPGPSDAWPGPGGADQGKGGVSSFGGLSDKRKIDRTKKASLDVPDRKVFPSPGGG